MSTSFPTALWASLTGLANPARFSRFADRATPILAVLAVLVTVAGLYMSFNAPADYQQGETVRIMFIHVPAAWLSMAFYMAMSVSALGTLVWRHPLADVSQRAAAPVGAAFTLLCLVTGSLWGRPTWGTYWAWDVRLTSVLILFLIYCGILGLWRAIDDPGRAARAVAILTLVGLINIPIIRESVNYWNTLHQPASVLRLGGSSIHPSMLWPLLVMAVGMTLLGAALHVAGMRTELMKRRLRTLEILKADRLEREALS